MWRVFLKYLLYYSCPGRKLSNPEKHPQQAYSHPLPILQALVLCVVDWCALSSCVRTQSNFNIISIISEGVTGAVTCLLDLYSTIIIINRGFTGAVTCPVYTFSYSQKNNFGSKNQEKYADPESTLFRHFLTKIRTVLCITIHICVDSHWFELITFE